MKKIYLFLICFTCLFTNVNAQFDKVYLDENNTVQNLTLNYNYMDYLILDWDIPADIHCEEKILSWSDDVFYTSVAVGIQEKQSAAHYFMADELAEYVGWNFEQIAFIPLGADNSHSIKIWQETDDEKVLVYEQEINNEDLLFGDWNYISLNESVVIEEDKNYYVGFSSDGTSNNHYIFPADNSVVNDGKSWVQLGTSWSDFSIIGRNLCIKTIIKNSNEKVAGGQLLGYGVYANGELVKEIDKPYITHYFDMQFVAENDIEYCVTAVYDDLESDALCVGHVGVEDVSDKESSLNVYPNPTNGKITVDAEISVIEVYNAQTQLVGRFKDRVIDLKTLPSGLYLLRIKDINDNVCVRKIVKE